jgi:hypothetical protein
MKPERIFSLAFTLVAAIATCAPLSAQSQIDEGAANRFAAAYSKAFVFVQQERSCCGGPGDPFAQWEASIDRIIAKFKSVGAGGLPPDLVSSWENLRDKHIAEQEAYRGMARFIAKVRSDHPGFRVGLRQDPRPLLPASRIPEWDALVKAADDASLQAVRSVDAFDKVWLKYFPRR